MAEFNLTCINCPMGCSLRATLDNGGAVGVTGNRCQRGRAYAEAEIKNPVRTLTSIVRVSDKKEMLSVKTAQPIPKSKLFEAMKIVNSISVKSPVAIGDVIVRNICDTGVDLVATKNI